MEPTPGFEGPHDAESRKCKWPPERWETVHNTETFVPFAPPLTTDRNPVQVERVVHKATRKVLGVVLRNMDGDNGRALAVRKTPFLTYLSSIPCHCLSSIELGCVPTDGAATV